MREEIEVFRSNKIDLVNKNGNKNPKINKIDFIKCTIIKTIKKLHSRIQGIIFQINFLKIKSC